MITSLAVEGLRGIREGKIEGLAPLTILVGPNGCGKSTVLEAAGVACAGRNAEGAFRALASREWLGLKGLSLWFDLTQGFAVHSTWTPWKESTGVETTQTSRVLAPSNGRSSVDLHDLRATYGDLGDLVLLYAQTTTGNSSVAISEDGNTYDTNQFVHNNIIPFALQTIAVDRPAGAARRMAQPRFSSALREALTRLKLSPLYDDFFSYLQVLRPTLVSIESIAVGDRDEPFFFEKTPERVGYPLAYAGDGFRRSLLLASTLVEARGGVAAMDEPESFAHPRMFGALAQLIHRAIDDGTQVLIATHSLEFVATLLTEFEKQPEQACVVGLTLENGVLDPLVVAGLEAYQRVVEWKDDLRL